MVKPCLSSKSVYNPDGKYTVKLFANGVARVVQVDDRLPITSQGIILASHSTNQDLWVSIIEKAYMKLHGGYDFPGSTSSVDIYSLTGWIPEDINFHSTIDVFDSKGKWDRLYSCFNRGRCVATISTHSSIEKLKNTGLEESHSYIVLDVVCIDQHKLLKVKNPWGKNRWTGAFSPHSHQWDNVDLIHSLKYDVMEARKKDDGVFWISWEDATHYFSTLHLSWNLKDYFRFYAQVHDYWDKSQTLTFHPVDDSSYALSPQYHLSVYVKKKTPVWIILSRHVSTLTDLEGDFFITLHVLKGDKRIYGKPLSHVRGTYNNSMHHRFVLALEPGQHDYIFVISQYKSIKNASFTVSSYMNQPFQLRTVPLYKEVALFGEW
eukprot:CAMPEP_0117418762 /NCGR_PEP_ID=MMETSP0758-20121206/479_1 /TAXON_ID=63605 /ORGANISM="Percolomonas cosmopolitus, Strain AE-1 (ATCC 50343)" /LENGTH=376 /DNA_ID=CAMNT_0005199461 /DNA_START=962 /DNA_END=2089 /DNA_ORIENTATION=+